MNVLVITQAIDLDDPTLSVYHDWLKAATSGFDGVTVICLKKGRHRYPPEIPVLSLGKEEGSGRIVYIIRLFSYLIGHRRRYDAVFVHMNQEYVLIAGWAWLLMGKRIYLWRNHHAGNWLTDIAALFCRKVFCTSAHSYTAAYKKTVLMPVGVDTERFLPGSAPLPNSLLFLGRLDPSKRPELFIEALSILKERGVQFSATIVGNPTKPHSAYRNDLALYAAEKRVADEISFMPGVANEATTNLYQSHAIFVNCSSSGMYDKTIFEAMACASLVAVSNRNLIGKIDPIFLFDEGDAASLGATLERLLQLPLEKRTMHAAVLRSFVESTHSMRSLSLALSEALRI